MASAVAMHRAVDNSNGGSPQGRGSAGVNSNSASSPSPPRLSNHDALPDDEDEDAQQYMVSSTLSSSSANIPPYWLGPNSSPRNPSSESLPTGVITLQDNDTSEHDDRNNACWAKSVEIVDYTIVNGGATSVGAFVVWMIRVETLSGSYMDIRKRYSEFDEFRRKLVRSFPNFEGAVPPLPPKSVISKFRPKFLDKRRAGLQYFLNCILLNPEFSGSPVLKEFLFS